MTNDSHQKRVKHQYDKTICPQTFSEGDLVLVYDQDHNKLGAGKFEPWWHDPYIITRFLKKGSYEIADYQGNPLSEPRNGLYLKKYYA